MNKTYENSIPKRIIIITKYDVLSMLENIPFLKKIVETFWMGNVIIRVSPNIPCLVIGGKSHIIYFTEQQVPPSYTCNIYYPYLSLTTQALGNILKNFKWVWGCNSLTNSKTFTFPKQRSKNVLIAACPEIAMLLGVTQ